MDKLDQIINQNNLASVSAKQRQQHGQLLEKAKRQRLQRKTRAAAEKETEQGLTFFGNLMADSTCRAYIEEGRSFAVDKRGNFECRMPQWCASPTFQRIRPTAMSVAGISAAVDAPEVVTYRYMPYRNSSGQTFGIYIEQ